MKKLNSIISKIRNFYKRAKFISKRILRYCIISFTVCIGSAVVLRLINAFLGINTPSIGWYIIPASLVGLVLTMFMTVLNYQKVFKKPTKKKSVTKANTKQKVRKKSSPAVSTPEREYRRKVS